jgi:ribosomal protein S4
MALTYQQDPRKTNTTIRLKRTAQRFNTGYKSIRMFKEDYLGTLSSRISRRKTFTEQEYKYPLSYKVPRVRPALKWNTLVEPKGTTGIGVSPLKVVEHTPFTFVAIKEVKGSKYIFKEKLNTNTRFVLQDARNSQQANNKLETVKNPFRISSLFFKLFHLDREMIPSYSATPSLATIRCKLIDTIRAKEEELQESISKTKSFLKYLQRKLQKGFRHPNKNRNKKAIEIQRRNHCLKEISTTKRKLSNLNYDLYKIGKPKYARKGPRWYRARNRTLYQIAVIDYRRISKVNTKKFVRFPQDSNFVVKSTEPTEPSWYNLQLALKRRKQYTRILHGFKETFKKLFRSIGTINPILFNAIMYNKMSQLMWLQPNFQYKEGIYKNIKTNALYTNIDNVSFWDTYYGQLNKRLYSEKIGFNVANYTTKGTEVLYRYMQNLREKFGYYQADIPFRIDDYLKAHEKKRRPTKYKQMCLARAKIRLFYGQLTVEKLGRLLRKTKASFPHMFGAMERRLDVILVRANFCKNIFTAQQVIKAGHILVNNKEHRNCYHAVKCYDFITFKSKQLETFCKHLILTKLRLNKFKFPPVSYLVVNYKLMYLYVRPFLDVRRQIGFTGPLYHSYLSKY